MNKLIEMLLEDSEYVCRDIDFSQLNNKKIMVTGASGLIGVNLLSTLLYLKLKHNYNIFVMAIFNSEPNEWFRELLDLGDFNYIKCDLSNIDNVKNLLDVDYIIHGATYGQPLKFMKDEVKTIELNTLTTNELIKRLKPNGKFMFISSSEIYSGLNSNEYCESDIGTTTPNHSRACYIEGKRCGEAICNSYIKAGIDVKIARLCLAYGIGSRLNDDRALNNFIIKGLEGHIKLMDSGEAQRTYLYVADAIQIMWNILLFGKDSIYNVGGKSKTTILNLAQLIGDNLNIDVECNHSNTLIGSPNSVCLNMDKIKNEFNKVEYIDLEEGIKKLIRWYKLLKE